MHNKKGIELSINFVVMLVIALAVFGMGLILFTQFFSVANEIKENLDEQTRQELTQKMMSSSEQVIVYPTLITLQKGHTDVIGVGILNIGGTTEFQINTNYSGCYDSSGTDHNCVTTLIGFPASRTVKVGLNKREIFSIPVRVDSNAGSYKYAIYIKVIQGGIPVGTNLVYINVH